MHEAVPHSSASLRESVEKLVSTLEIPSVVHRGFSTKCIHVGQEPEEVHGSVNVPIHMVSTFKQGEPGKPLNKHIYTRITNPTVDAFDQCLAALEYGKHCRSFSSGIASIYTVFSTFKTGDHIIVCDEIYGGTTNIVQNVLVPNYGLEIDFVNFSNLDNVRKAIKPNTKLIWFETPTNPLLTIIDIEEVVKIAKEHNILTGIDNTFATPYLQSPLLLGVDVSAHAVTKYLAGHCDISAGAIICNDDELFNRIFLAGWSQGNNSNAMLGFLASRGLKTLKVRMDTACRNAYILAHWLKADPRVEAVYYPGLADHPGHDIAKKQMRGFGGMVSLLVKGDLEKTIRFLSSLKRFILAFSLGGVESLCEHPAKMTHMMLSKEERERIGIRDNLVRLSIGQEDVEDLIADLDQGLNA